jgi:hypothetical protein
VSEGTGYDPKRVGAAVVGVVAAVLLHMIAGKHADEWRYAIGLLTAVGVYIGLVFRKG